jgi:hypothetical protein
MSRTPTQRQWRSQGNDPLPSDQEAIDEPSVAFPSWFLQVECDRCGKVQMVNQAHQSWNDIPLRAILNKIRHDGLRRTVSVSRTTPSPTRA